MSRFKFTGQLAEILTEGTEEVDLIPGEEVEISEGLQRNAYCQRLVSLGLLTRVTEPTPTPAPAPAPTPTPAPAPVPAPGRRPARPAKPGQRKEPEPVADVDADADADSESESDAEEEPEPQENIYPTSGYPLYPNLRPKDSIYVDPQSGFMFLAGEKSSKILHYLEYKKDVNKFIEDWGKQHPKDRIPFNHLMERRAELEKVADDERQPERWVIPDRYIDPIPLPIQLQGGEEEIAAGDGYPFFRNLLGDREPRRVSYSSELNPETFSITSWSNGVEKTRTIKTSDWIRDYKAAREFERVQAMIKAGVPKIFPDSSIVKNLKARTGLEG